MTAVLVNDPPFPQRAIQGATVAVASIERPTVPLVVGICEVDIANLDAVQGLNKDP
jgi:translation initiation factor 2D